MVNLTKEELEQFELIGQGTFGKVYRKDDKVYKLYRDLIKTDTWYLAKNPSLKYKLGRLNRLISLNKKLKHNDLIEDIVFLDGKFQGIIRPYYEGVLLSQTMEKPLEEKIEIAEELVRNSKELTRHFIYPLDYKLNNMILTQNEVRFLDLDDYHTKVDLFINPVHKNSCIKGLDETIKTYFHEYKTFPTPKELSEKIQRKRILLSDDYEGIEKYIDKKKTRHNYILFNAETDIYNYIELLRKNNFRKIYIYDHENLEEKIDYLLNLGVNIYDVVSNSEIKKYMNSFLYDKCLGIKEDKVMKLKK